MKAWLLVFICSVRPAFGLELEGAYARALLRARDGRAATRLAARFERARVAQLACRYQLARGLAPIACYEPLALEREWRVRGAAGFHANRAELDRLCLLAAERLRVPAAGRALAHVSPSCARRVREARITEAYRRADRSWSGD